jgi:hypothetical protein
MLRAPLYTEPHWYTGKPKVRCAGCDKVAYPDEETAQLRARQISEREPMRHYRGRCGHWHVARIRRRG